MDHLTNRNTKVLTFMQSLSRYLCLNRSGLPFILIQQFMGGNECGKSGHLSIFTSLKHLMINAFEVQFFQGFIFTPYKSKTLIACRAMQLRFFLK